LQSILIGELLKKIKMKKELQLKWNLHSAVIVKIIEDASERRFRVPSLLQCFIFDGNGLESGF